MDINNKIAKRLSEKIEEVNEYIKIEYSYDPHFDFDIIDELTTYIIGLNNMGIVDLKLIQDIGYICALTGNKHYLEIRKLINSSINEYYIKNPDKQPTFKNNCHYQIPTYDNNFPV